MHTTGTTTPEGVHQLAPGLGERRPMTPPSGGQFKLPAAFQPPQESHTEAQAHAGIPAAANHALPQEQLAHPTRMQPEMQAALPVHKVDITGSTAPAPGGFPPVQPQLDAARTAPQVILPPAHVAQAQQQAPAADWRAMTAAQPASPLGFNPPAPAGYQSAPAHVPPGMVAHTVQHTTVAPQQPFQPQTVMGTGGGGGVVWPSSPAAAPRQLGPYEVAPAQQRAAAPAMPWQPSSTMAPQLPAPLLPEHQPPRTAQGTVVRLEGDPATVEAALGMLMMRGVRVTLVP